ncbi:hypothetical protein PVL29_023781 [Vitis rotundifolia]|uniref:EF-hand domain-containing protein n=1 Tax=Vitis rotundifolia TaxID=103349 RepID=A0AA39D9T0_VITRO|nr:hypothetical protein PVL29_023781 [Vitis rotundifolia]
MAHFGVRCRVRMPITKERVKAAFRKYDRDGDGRLSKEELQATLQGRSSHVPCWRASLAAFQHLGALIPGWRAHRALHHADANGDGCISEKEMKDLVEYAAKFGYTIN